MPPLNLPSPSADATADTSSLVVGASLAAAQVYACPDWSKRLARIKVRLNGATLVTLWGLHAPGDTDPSPIATFTADDDGAVPLMPWLALTSDNATAAKVTLTHGLA